MAILKMHFQTSRANASQPMIEIKIPGKRATVPRVYVSKQKLTIDFYMVQILPVGFLDALISMLTDDTIKTVLIVSISVTVSTGQSIPLITDRLIHRIRPND